MTDCRWILSKRISRSPKFQVVSHRDLEHDSFLVFYLWFAPAGWWGIGQRQVCLPKDWLSSSSAPWKQKTKELAGTPFGHKVWRQRGSKGWGEEKKNTDTAFCFASQLWFYTFVTMREMQKTSHACAAFSAVTSGWKWGRDPRAGGW